MNAHQRLRLIVARAKMNTVNDSRGRQRVQVDALVGETKDSVPRYQNFGHTAVPLPGATVILVAVGGDRDNLAAIVVDDAEHRPTGMQPGESALYNAHGITLMLDEEGTATLTCKKFQVAAESAGFDCPVDFAEPITTAGITNLGLKVEGHNHPIPGGNSGPMQ